MAEVTMSLIDKRRSLHQVVSREFAAALVAALSADPETIEELHQALVRFWDFTRGAEFVTGWSDGTPTTSKHCSVGVVDLADRVVTLPPEMEVPSPHGCIQYLDADSQAKFSFGFNSRTSGLLVTQQRRTQRNGPGSFQAVIIDGFSMRRWSAMPHDIASFPRETVS